MTQQATTTIPDACETLKILWLRANRGKLATIAHKLGIKAQTVYRVYWARQTPSEFSWHSSTTAHQ